MRWFVCALLFCSTAFAATVEEMQAAVQANQDAQALASALKDKKQQLDAALAAYTAFRAEHPNLAVSQENAQIIAEADAMAGLKSDESLQKAKVAADRAKAGKAAAANAAVDGKRSDLQRRLIVAKNRVKIAENALVAAQAEFVAAGGNPVTRAGQAVHNASQVGGGNSYINNNNTRVTHVGVANNGSAAATTAAVNREVYQAAEQKFNSAQAALDNANIELETAQKELNAFEKAQAAENKDKPAASDTPAPAPTPAAPASTEKKPTTTYVMKDGTKYEASSSVDSGDVYVIKTSSGVKTIKKADVADVQRDE